MPRRQPRWPIIGLNSRCQDVTPISTYKKKWPRRVRVHFSLDLARLLRHRIPQERFKVPGTIYFQSARQCAGINRHTVGDESALQERNSETILASSFASGTVGCRAKRKQRERWAGGLSSEKLDLGCRPCCRKGKAISQPPLSARRLGISRSRRAQHALLLSRGKPYAREPNLQRRETSVLAASSSPAREGEKPKLGMHGTEESESAVVPMKEPNEGRPGRPRSPR